MRASQRFRRTVLAGVVLSFISAVVQIVPMRTLEWRPYYDADVPVVSQPVPTSMRSTAVLAEPSCLKNGTDLPEWMQKYMSWHAQARAELNASNWNSYLYYVMRCFREENECGGASDRLKTVPFSILMASQSKRLFFIKWERPAPLQRFLVPPPGGLDWRLPEWLDKLLPFQTNPVIDRSSQWPNVIAEHQNDVLLDSVIGDGVGKQSEYDRFKPNCDPDFREVFHTIWKHVFVPAAPIQERINDQMRILGLLPGQYLAVHIRAVYHQDLSNDIPFLRGTIDCAVSTDPNLPIYVVSDANNATRNAIEIGQHEFSNRSWVASSSRPAPRHVDRGESPLQYGDTTASPPSAYYDTFIDLYLLAQGSCVISNQGGFGHWASLISDSSCWKQCGNKDPIGERINAILMGNKTLCQGISSEDNSTQALACREQRKANKQH